MTIGKVQARGGKLPTAEQLEQLVKEHPAPPAQGEVSTEPHPKSGPTRQP